MCNEFTKEVLTEEIGGYINKCNKILENITKKNVDVKTIPITIADVNKEYKDENLKSEYNEKDLANIVYLIYTNDTPSDVNLLRKIKERRTNIKNEKTMCRINNDNHAAKKQNDKWKDLSKDKIHYLYVGGSSHFLHRINQHLGLIDDKTSSLKIKEWYDLWSPKMKIEIVFWDLTEIFNKNLYKDNKVMLAERQIIEDLLYDKYQPLFGKKGAR